MRTQLVEKTEYKKVIPYLQKNQAVVVPSETVYGLAANAESDIACKNIFALKNRPVDNPLIVHCTDIDMAQQYMCRYYEQAKDISTQNMQGYSTKEIADWYTNSYNKAMSILKNFAPAPISVITFASKKVSAVARANSHTVAIRIPAHPVFRNIISAFGKALAAPSANISGFPSPTNALMSWEAMSYKVSAIVDGGQCKVGLESTIIDCTGIALYEHCINKEKKDTTDMPKIINSMYSNSVSIVRVGSITADSIYDKTKLKVIDMCEHTHRNTKKMDSTDTNKISKKNEKHNRICVATTKDSPMEVTVPGAKYRHYAPHTKVVSIPNNIFNKEHKEKIVYSHSNNKKALQDIHKNNIKETNSKSIEYIVYNCIIPLLQRKDADTTCQYQKVGIILGPVAKKLHQVLYTSIIAKQTMVSISMIRMFSTWQELTQRLYEYFAISDRLHLEALFVCTPYYNEHASLYDRIQRASQT